MKKLASLLIFFSLLTVKPSSPVHPQQILQSEELQMAAQIPQILWISIEKDTITFSGADPTYPPSLIPARENPVEIYIWTWGIGRQTFYLHVLANGNLESGKNQIPIDNISWTATSIHSPGGNFFSGTMSAIESQLAGRWRGSSLIFPRQGRFEFFYLNDPQPPGQYTQTVTFTLSVQ